MDTLSKKLPLLELRLLAFAGVKSEDAARRLGAYYRAVENGSAKKIRDLLREGMDPNKRLFMESMLALAARKNRANVIEALLEADADPNIERGSPLIVCVGKRNLTAVRALIAAGANVNLRGPGDFPALTDACFTGNVEMVEMLVKAGAKLDKRCEVKLSGTRGSTEATPLIIAVWEGHADVVKALLIAGAKRTGKDSAGRTALDWARVSRKPTAKQILSLLEKAGDSSPAGALPIQLQPDFSIAANRREFRQALSKLKGLIHKSPHPLRAADGTPIKGGFFFIVPERAATALVSKHQRQFHVQGCLLFCTKGQSKRGESEVGILPSADVFEAIAALQTNGANYRVSNEDIIKRMRKLTTKQPFTLTGLGYDYLAGQFTTPIVDSQKLAKWLYQFCPDLGDVNAAANQLRETREFFLWWD
jgi:hypothetical protein